ncbi:MAG: rhomboid family intramembrane serine protease [Flavobacteriales bacterium]|jgi:membrane associated rhomboid family serine protease|nr:rhomboid family intramembrane serine protease [Flavobacteriaceae bacterium]RZP00235.1 MAG: rhomboid family intramembrane serine protease [Flavobacteriales bacterium]|tara:strand:- start:82 stop:834 length:753 start_codon:yes stop_codon:yes gene_type:complete
MFRSITDGVKHLLIINVIMFGATILINPEMMYSNYGLFFPENNTFRIWQLFTHMFMHGGLSHILFNMFALYMFGTAVEQIYGTNKFLLLYFSSGLGAALIALLFSYYNFYSILDVLVSSDINKSEILDTLNQGKYNTGWLSVINDVDLNTFTSAFNTSMVGASGAIFGILVAFGYLFPETKLMLLFVPFPVKAKYFIPGIILLDLFSATTGVSIFSPSNTAYIAHLGGALTGFLVIYYWKKNQFNSNRWD